MRCSDEEPDCSAWAGAFELGRGGGVGAGMKRAAIRMRVAVPKQPSCRVMEVCSLSVVS